MTQVNRQSPRYKMTNATIVTAKFDRTGNHSDKVLATLGEGGCGFISSTMDKRYQPVKRIYVKLTLTSGNDAAPVEIEVQGNLMYVQPIQLDGKEFFFYGVQFISAHLSYLKPIITELETLAKEGKIEYAA
jgi:hypothetical protein